MKKNFIAMCSFGAGISITLFFRESQNEGLVKFYFVLFAVCFVATLILLFSKKINEN